MYLFAPVWEIDFMKEIPTTWDETLYIDGYPGKYTIIARRNGEHWYIGGVSALEQPLELELYLPMIVGEKISIYSDDSDGEAFFTNREIKNNGKVKVTLQPNGGFVIKQ